MHYSLKQTVQGMLLDINMVLAAVNPPGVTTEVVMPCVHCILNSILNGTSTRGINVTFC